MSILIGKVIYQVLSANPQLQAKVGAKIYPLVADVDTTFPFIIYKRQSVQPIQSKCRLLVQEKVNVEVLVAATKYNECIEIAQLVKESLQGLKGTYCGLQVEDSQLVTADEDFLQDTFVQSLTFSMVINYGN